jgi:ATP-binding cassette subfamily B protein
MADAVIENMEEELDEVSERPFNYGYFKRLMGYVKPYRRQLIVVLALILVSTITTLLEPALIAVAVDRAVPEKNMPLLAALIATFFVFRLIVWAAAHVRMYRINVIGQTVLYDLRKELFGHIQMLSLRFYDSRPVGKIMSRITSDVGAINELLTGGVATILVEGLSLIGIIVIMLLIDWRLALASFAITPSFYFLFGKLRVKIENTWKNVRKSASNLNGNLNESVNGIRVTQAFGREGRNIEKFARINANNRDINVQAVKYDNIIWPSVEMVGTAGSALLMWFGALQVLNGTLSLGVILAFINYVWRFWGPVSALSRVYSQVLAAMASAERIFEFLDTKPEVANTPAAKAIPKMNGEVTLENVTFKYAETAKPALRDVTLRVKPGQTVAIVGPTGAGKTTIVNLIMRFYDPTEGAVKIDGRDLRDVTLESVRSQISLVLQDPFLFSGSIGNNIRYGNLDATQEQVEAAAKAVRLDEFINKLPEKYEYDVQERGGRLSLGQRQLVSFARALLADPRILILDEATSSVDTQTERMIQHALSVLLAGRTAFIIAHRLSTIRNADVIVVMQEGQIAEQGSHEELVARRGLYYRLVHAHEQSRKQLEGLQVAPMAKPERVAVGVN